MKKVILIILLAFSTWFTINFKLYACSPSVAEYISRTEFAYVKVLERDQQDLYYKDIKIVNGETETNLIKYVFIKVQIFQIMNTKSFQDYDLNQKITIGVSSIVFDKIKTFDELILSSIDANRYRNDVFWDLDNNQFVVENDIFYYDKYNQVNGLIPVKNGKIYLDGFNKDVDYSGFSAINMLDEGNFSDELVFKHGMTISELDEYFVKRKNEAPSNVCGNFYRTQIYVLLAYVIIAIIAVSVIVIIVIVINKYIKRRN